MSSIGTIMRVPLYVGSMAAMLACSTGTGLARCDPSAGTGVTCARLGEQFELRVGETAYIADTRFTVRVKAVPEDSRCPRDAVCVWAGNARVALALREAAKAEDADVNSTLEPHAATRWGYTVELVDVQPVPTAGEPTSADRYLIRLVVTRAAD
jgi:hypothetical protein